VKHCLTSAELHQLAATTHGFVRDDTRIMLPCMHCHLQAFQRKALPQLSWQPPHTALLVLTQVLSLLPCMPCMHCYMQAF
jgi:hypothetical protein